MPNIRKFKHVTSLAGLGVFSYESQIFLLYRLHKKEGSVLRLDKSSDGISFHPALERVEIRGASKKRLAYDRLKNFRVSTIDNVFFTTFLYSPKGVSRLYQATSTDLMHFHVKDKISPSVNSAHLIPNTNYHGDYILYSGGKYLRMATSPDLNHWYLCKDHIMGSPVPEAEIEIALVKKVEAGIMVIYYLKIPQQPSGMAIFGALFDDQDPARLIWQGKDPIFEMPYDRRKSEIVQPLGVVHFNDQLISYWQKGDREIFAVTLSSFQKIYDSQFNPSFLLLKKIKENPIIKPIIGHFWESKATFNPAAILDQDKVHILYRAIGDSDMSTVGYAASHDGVRIDERLDEPVYIPTEPFEFSAAQPAVSNTPSISPFMSGGGGYGGCEDPRITKIADKYYMTYVAYDGSGPPRVALTSIKEHDFQKKNWSWSKPVLISPPDVVDKNCVIFPEKINGKFVIMHRIFPNILIDFVDSLDFDGSFFLTGQFKLHPRLSGWDSRKIGAGAPPIKTSSGWLLIYHAVGETDSSRYKIGAMLLDLKDPTTEIARSRIPILEPTENYENEGFKSGVTYPCGAVVKDKNLLVYYGGADTVTCVATANLSTFLQQLLETGSTRFEEVSLHQMF